MTKVFCDICGNKFQPEHYNEKYCGERCRKKARENNIKKRYFKNKIENENYPYIRICEYCGKVHVSLKRKDKKYCSKKCCWKAQYIGRREEILARERMQRRIAQKIDKELRKIPPEQLIEHVKQNFMEEVDGS